MHHTSIVAGDLGIFIAGPSIHWHAFFVTLSDMNVNPAGRTGPWAISPIIVGEELNTLGLVLTAFMFDPREYVQKD